MANHIPPSQTWEDINRHVVCPNQQPIPEKEQEKQVNFYVAILAVGQLLQLMQLFKGAWPFTATIQKQDLPHVLNVANHGHDTDMINMFVK